MDCLRSCYQSYMRLYPEHPEILTLGRWRWCPDGAKALPFAHAFGSVTGDPWQWGSEYQLGEVYGLAGGTKGLSNARYRGRNYCGPVALWQEGSPLALMGTPPVDVEGVPRCCETARAELGGVVANGNGGLFGVGSACWWLAPELLERYSLSDFIPQWESAALPSIPAEAPAPGMRPLVGVGTDFAPVVAWLETQDQLVRDGAFALGEFALYMVGSQAGGDSTVGPAVVGASLLSPFSIITRRTGVAVASNHSSLNWAHTQNPIPPTIWSVRRAGGLWTLAVNGVAVATNSIGSGDIFRVEGVGIGVSLLPIADGAFWAELLLYCRALTDDEDDVVMSYLLRKYLFNTILSESGNPLETEDGKLILQEEDF